ncbi:MAG: TonB-dependent receptor, partial [Spirochaetaceae bacterium]|nr:TonB-dependent receptor [Spirochaetaceae bacterium]
MRHRFLRIRLLLTAALLSTLALPAVTREIEIKVVDGDLDEPLAGAVVHLPDGTVQDTGSDGTAIFSLPDEESQEIRISYPGYERALLMVGTDNSYTVTMRMFARGMENEELVIEGAMPGTGKARSGRSVSMNREEIVLTAEIGLIEDIMASIKLLPGVGYTGVFNANPSIRGGQPGDLKASLDGFYVDNPYHWGGAYSIFDPKIIESAELHHGVFSARYTHTISGLLELKSLRASSDYVEAGLNLSTSAAGFNVSYPLPDFSNMGGEMRGAVMLIGKITYWDPFVALAKEFSNFIPILLPINVVSVAPYIRALTMLANYRLSAGMELNITGYVGGDGVGLLYNNSSRNIDILSNSTLKFTWDNLIAFSAINLLANPNPDMMIKTNIGFSYDSQIFDAEYSYDVARSGIPLPMGDSVQKYEDKTIGIQARVDFDWDIKNGFLFSAGVEELNRRWIETAYSNVAIDGDFSDEYRAFLRVTPDVDNMGFFSGLYSLVEYKDPTGRFDAEAGLRMDHLYFAGNTFYIQTMPVLNPRLNFAYYPLKNRGGVDLLTLTAGTGLFSSLNDNIAYIDKSYGIKDFDLKQSRALTGVTGMELDFLGDWI